MHRQFKILLLGDSAVGKTALLHQLADKHYTAQYKATLGVDSRDVKFQINGQRITLVVWDTASQDTSTATLAPFYFRGCDGVAFVYDLTSPASLAGIETWHRLVGEKVDLNSGFPLILLGNKSDLSKQQKVSLADADEVKRNLQLSSVEMVSAKTGVNVEAAFRKLAVLCIKKSLADGEDPQQVDDFVIQMCKDGEANGGQRKASKKCSCV